MKSVIKVLIILALFNCINYAQFVRGYGIKLGATVSQQDWNYNSTMISSFDANKTGFNAGVFAELLDIPVVSVVAELNYVQKGFKDEIPETTFDNPEGTGRLITQDASINYLNISALAKIRYSLGVVSPYLAIGPKFDYQLSKSSSLNDLKDINKDRLGLKVGIGSEFNLVMVTLLAEFMYDADFKELYDNQNLNIKTHSFDFRVGILF